MTEAGGIMRAYSFSGRIRRSGIAFVVIVFFLIGARRAGAEAPKDIYDAARKGTASQALSFISRGDAADSPDENGLTPLMYASWFNPDPAVAKVFIDAKARIGYSPGSGLTAAMLACWNENPAIIELLSRYGADFKRTDEYGTTALMLASRYNRNPAVIAALLKIGGKIGARTSFGWTALMFAAESNPDPRILDSLLDAGADMTDHDKNGRTIWSLAAASNPNPAVIARLKLRASLSNSGMAAGGPVGTIPSVQSPSAATPKSSGLENR
jgi:ankyrin repeat protein